MPSLALRVGKYGGACKHAPYGSFIVRHSLTYGGLVRPDAPYGRWFFLILREAWFMSL